MPLSLLGGDHQGIAFERAVFFFFVIEKGKGDCLDLETPKNLHRPASHLNILAKLDLILTCE